VIADSPKPADIEDIPINIEDNIEYLIQMRYNKVYLDGLTVSQINEEYEKCHVVEECVPTNNNEIAL